MSIFVDILDLEKLLTLLLNPYLRFDCSVDAAMPRRNKDEHNQANDDTKRSYATGSCNCIWNKSMGFATVKLTSEDHYLAIRR